MRSMIPSWQWQTRGMKSDPKQWTNSGPGAARLDAVALRSVAWNIDHITPEILECVPWVVGKRIADYLTRTETWNLKTWKTFAAAYPEENDRILAQYKITIRTREGENLYELDSITKFLSALPFNHITMLNIQRLKFTKNAMLAVSRIPNLGILALDLSWGDNCPDSISATFMQRWCRLVVEEGRLSKLKVIALRSFELSLLSLHHLAGHPALVLCNIESLKSKVEWDDGAKSSCGWELLSSTEVDGDLKSMWNDPKSTVHQILQKVYKYAVKQTKPDAEHEMSRPATLSIDYGAARSSLGATSLSSLWYTRVAPLPEASSIPRETITTYEPQGPVKKKRKLRPGKQMDIGDILGGF